jgi:hypothetical protein
MVARPDIGLVARKSRVKGGYSARFIVPEDGFVVVFVLLVIAGECEQQQAKGDDRWKPHWAKITDSVNG